MLYEIITSENETNNVFYAFAPRPPSIMMKLRSPRQISLSSTDCRITSYNVCYTKLLRLVFPRVPGHEMVVRTPSGARYVVWPGSSCGECPYCRDGRENLCEEMKITGFHNDGGFASSALVPEKSLIPLPDGISDHLGCFAEPVGCVVNAFSRLRHNHA